MAVLIFSSTTVFQSCASKNKISKSKVSFETIYFGKGGGFTNLIEKYVLKENGAVYKLTEAEEQEINRIKKSQLRKIDQKLITLDFQSISLDEPGNMTYFMEVKSDDHSNELAWNDATDFPGIKDFYNMLVSECLNP